LTETGRTAIDSFYCAAFKNGLCSCDGICEKNKINYLADMTDSHIAFIPLAACLFR
jgi:hypothetical protein